jgi:hypothetical protein
MGGQDASAQTEREDYTVPIDDGRLTMDNYGSLSIVYGPTYGILAQPYPMRSGLFTHQIV